jgi:hypothetical protein
MRTSTLILSLVLACSFLQVHAQPVITQANFPRQAEFVDTVHLASSVNVPSEGPNQFWDYSGVVTANILHNYFLDAASDTVVAGATSMQAVTFTFQGLAFEGYNYTMMDAQGWWDFGRQTFDSTHSLTFISGGANDEITFTAYSEVYVGKINSLKFPVTYNDSWVESRLETLPFTLTVAAFGLNNTPCHRLREFGHTRTVVGHGHMLIPDDQGMPSDSIEVLQIRVDQVYLDSFFLNGAPAPKALLDAFQLVQGNTFTNSYYVFYTPGYGAPVANINTQGSMGYRPAAARKTNVSVNNPDGPGAVRIHPNPVRSGQTLTLHLDRAFDAGHISLMDITGRVVHTTTLNAAQGPVQFQVPASTATGMYLIGTSDRNGRWTSMGKLLVD